MKPEGANSEENNRLPHVLCGLVGQEGLVALLSSKGTGCLDAKQAAQGPGQLSGSQPPAGTGSRWEVKWRTGKKALDESKTAAAAAKSNQAKAVTPPALSQPGRDADVCRNSSRKARTGMSFLQSSGRGMSKSREGDALL